MVDADGAPILGSFPEEEEVIDVEAMLSAEM